MAVPEAAAAVPEAAVAVPEAAVALPEELLVENYSFFCRLNSHTAAHFFQ